MKKQIINNTRKGIKTLIEKNLQQNANCTSCIVFYQPTAPIQLEKFVKKHNAK